MDPSDPRVPRLGARRDALALKLIEGGLHRDDAADAVAAVFGAAAEAAAKILGAPDLAADVAGNLAERIALIIAEAVRPDPEEVLKRANKALREGKGKKARRLFRKAERLFGGE